MGSPDGAARRARPTLPGTADVERARVATAGRAKIVSVASFPVTRLRRFRRTAALRGLVRETRLSL